MRRLPVRIFNALRPRQRLPDAEPHHPEGLRVLLRAYAEEARLTPFGRWMAAQQIAALLRARCELDAAVRADLPPIRQPLFILGLPRTGTTALHHLLCQDPAHQGLEYWLGAAPRPRPPRERWPREPRYREAAAGLRLTYFLDPGLRAIHDMRADLPDECRHLFLLDFADDTFDSNATIPSYTAWLRQRDMRPAYALHRDALRLIGSTSPERRWVLKYPAHLGRLDALLATYPDACFVQTHRDPTEVLPSLCSLVVGWRSLYEDDVPVDEIVRWQIEMWAERLERALAVRDRLPAGRFLDLHHREIGEDPRAALRRIYDHFGFAWSDPPLRLPPRHGRHRLRVRVARDAVTERFRFYTERFRT